MSKILLRVLGLFVVYRLFSVGYNYIVGTSKPYYCIGECSSVFERWSAGIPMIILGIMFMFFIIKSIKRKKEDLVKKGKYCWKKGNNIDPYCCKCHEEDNRIRKLKKIGDKYLCMVCDYGEKYTSKKDIEHIDIKEAVGNMHSLEGKR